MSFDLIPTNNKLDKLIELATKINENLEAIAVAMQEWQTWQRQLAEYPRQVQVMEREQRRW